MVPMRESLGKLVLMRANVGSSSEAVERTSRTYWATLEGFLCWRIGTSKITQWHVDALVMTTSSELLVRRLGWTVMNPSVVDVGVVIVMLVIV